MVDRTAEVVICGAGIAGIAAAYSQAVDEGLKDILLVDPRAPMSLTSDKSTECYRNWWPGPDDSMVRFMNRSIDLLETHAQATRNAFHLNRRGYVFLTADPTTAARYERSAQAISRLGAGPLRVHRGQASDPPYIPAPEQGYEGLPTGADLILDPALIRARYPFITERAIAMLHIRRCGWLSAQQLGAHLLRAAEEGGVRLLRAEVTGVELAGGRIKHVELSEENQVTRVATPRLVLAAGPRLPHTASLIDLDLPVYNELHGKVAFKDPLGVIPRDVPLMLWDDPVRLAWSAEERRELAEDADTRWLLERLPAGVHFRPEGGPDSPMVLALWTYDLHPQEAVWPPHFEPEYPEVVLRGLVTMVPGLAAYVGRWGRPAVDGGYYCKTRENRPLIGPLPVEGAYVFGALSGFGIMAALAGAELLTAHITGSELPAYAPAFSLERYQDPAYLAILPELEKAGGQL